MLILNKSGQCANIDQRVGYLVKIIFFAKDNTKFIIKEPMEQDEHAKDGTFSGGDI